MNRRTAVHNLMAVTALASAGLLPMADPELMVIERLENGQWARRRMEELHKGDRFRVLYPDGKPFCDSCTAVGEPYKVTNENGVKTWGIYAQELYDFGPGCSLSLTSMYPEKDPDGDWPIGSNVPLRIMG